jgi:hypothetical protein
MAGGWTGDGAVLDQIDDTVLDAVLSTPVDTLMVNATVAWEPLPLGIALNVTLTITGALCRSKPIDRSAVNSGPIGLDVGHVSGQSRQPARRAVTDVGRAGAPEGTRSISATLRPGH